ncbi:MAG TPA: alpha/beta hydrolase [Vicinamibacterales bacterium]|nr:alpha/beta hydrolase [Vicinamibacterales bacterium]
MLPLLHCTVLLAVALAAAPAQAVPQPEPGPAVFNVFFKGTLIGTEQVMLARASTGWTITSTGHSGAPLNLTVNQFEMRYSPDWQPIDLRIEATAGTDSFRLATSFAMTTAINEITKNDVTTSKNDQISAGTIVLPNSFYAGYEALAARLSVTKAGDTLPIYVAPQSEIRLTVRTVTPETLKNSGGAIEAQRFDVTFQNPGGPLDASIVVDAHARLVRVDLPSVGLAVVRNDASGVGTRPITVRNPTDADVTIPANGFNLAGTITTPPGTGRLRYPAILLIGGAGPIDRDETVAGIAIFAQLARALADAGYVVLRYDKRGGGQSGGRTETATLDDYADDALAALKWLRDRDDVDDRHVALAGHSEGGAIAMIAAAREKKDVDAVILIATPGSTGADLLLRQQQHLLDTMKIPDADKQAKIDLQKKIQAAVVSGKGWEGIPANLRKQADTPWFRSLLLFDPAKVLPKTKQPVLVIQGDLDTEVPPSQADALGQLAKGRKKGPPSDVVHIPGINHLLVPATTGEMSEYSQLADKTISPKVAAAIVDWLKRIW